MGATALGQRPEIDCQGFAKASRGVKQAGFPSEVSVPGLLLKIKRLPAPLGKKGLERGNEHAGISCAAGKMQGLRRPLQRSGAGRFSHLPNHPRAAAGDLFFDFFAGRH